MNTSSLSGLIKNPWVIAVLTFVVGLGLGLLYAWQIDPVQWKDADFTYLRADLKEDYARTTALAFATDRDPQAAAARIGALGADWQSVVASAAAKAAPGSADQVALSALQSSLAGLPPAVAPAPASGGLAGMLLPLMGCLLVVAVLLGGGYLFLRSRGGVGGLNLGRPAAAKPAASPMPEFMDVAASGQPAPAGAAGSPAIARFMTTYTLGDDAYDDSFSIDGPDGNFLGECGMGISEPIGVGDPKKVTAFEVWLFDKNDIRTVTKVIMSEHAFRDEALKSRLAAKGEPVLATPGDSIALETATLVVTARVVDMAYGGGALPPSSFFERLTIELQAYRKPA